MRNIASVLPNGSHTIACQSPDHRTFKSLHSLVTIAQWSDLLSMHYPCACSSGF